MKAVHAGTLGLAMLLAAVATIAGNPATAPAPPSPTPGYAAGASGVPRLTSREKAQRIRDLPEEERRWLTDYVAPIILSDGAEPLPPAHGGLPAADIQGGVLEPPR